MIKKKTPEQIIAKLREAGVRLAQGERTGRLPVISYQQNSVC
ncbi:hypothetical protein [Ahrensia sp. R2A130]|nr:hypothetical protein [Ahrensia sp. R2A130]EFL87532.1 hypothetical protein R2A130_3529 [Ahrensia sp. R2A130]